MHVLVTGGAGFIGSHLTDALLDRGDEVSVVDDLSSGRLTRLNPRIALHKVSVTSASALAGIVQRARPEVIFHLAAQVDVRASVAAPGRDADINVGGTVKVLEAAQATGVPVIFASTGGAMYGMNASVPSPENLLPVPEAPYGTAKYCAEQYIGLYNRMHGARHAILRLGNVYGPRQDPNGEAGVVAIFCGSVLRCGQVTVYGDGTQTRDYVYVGDVVSALLAAAKADRPGLWNIGTGIETSVLELVDLVGHVAGRSVGPRFAGARAGELQRSALDVTRAANELGWKATTPLAAGIGKVWGWVQDGENDTAFC